MSTREIAIYDETYEAVGDLSTNQYQGVGIGSTGEVGGGSQIVGIQQNKPEVAGQAIQVRHHGISRMKVNGSGTPIVRGSPLTGVNTPGVVATIGTIAIAVALEPTSANGVTIAVLMTGPFRMHS